MKKLDKNIKKNINKINTKKMGFKIKKYVLGLIFSSCNEYIILVQNEQHDFQLNGVIDKIQNFDDSPKKTLTRNSLTVTNIYIPQDHWSYLGMLYSDKKQIFIYKTQTEFIHYFKKNNKNLFVIKVSDLFKYQYDGCTPYLKWLIPFSLQQNFVFLIKNNLI